MWASGRADRARSTPTHMHVHAPAGGRLLVERHLGGISQRDFTPAGSPEVALARAASPSLFLMFATCIVLYYIYSNHIYGISESSSCRCRWVPLAAHLSRCIPLAVRMPSASLAPLLAAGLRPAPQAFPKATLRSRPAMYSGSQPSADKFRFCSVLSPRCHLRPLPAKGMGGRSPTACKTAQRALR